MSQQPPSVNYWPDSRCAKAFWNQYELPPYQQLLHDTAEWVDPRPEQRWIDLGCGCGQLTKMLWNKSRGAVSQIVGVDVAQVNERAYEKLRSSVQPKPAADVIRFETADLSCGLPRWQDGSFDGAVSGLAIQYAESYDETTGRWTREAYQSILAETYRLLTPGGVFVFSVNVPEPAWNVVAWNAISGTWQSRRPLKYLKHALRIYRYGNWLKREARRGRFHYLPDSTIEAMLLAAGFQNVEIKTSFAGQAYLVRCHKPLRRRGAATSA